MAERRIDRSRKAQDSFLRAAEALAFPPRVELAVVHGVLGLVHLAHVDGAATAAERWLTHCVPTTAEGGEDG